MASAIPTTTRRALLASVPALVAAGAAPAFAAPADEIDALWTAIVAAIADVDRAVLAYNAAKARLPWWAASGPSRINSEGKLVGPESGWPARQDVDPPEHPGAFRRIRSGLHDLRDDYRHMVMFAPAAARARIRAAYRQKVRDMIALRRAQMAEKKLAGVDVASGQLEAAYDRQEAVFRTIRELPATTPNVIAARLLESLLLNPMRDETPEGLCEATEQDVFALLGAMRPALSGAVRASVEAVFADLERPIRESVGGVPIRETEHVA